MRLLRNLKIRWKLLAVVLPLVMVPIFSVGVVVGYVAQQQAYLGITQTSAADLEHMAQFTLDLLNAHYQQFQVYKQDRRRLINEELATLVNFASNFVGNQHQQYLNGTLDLQAAKQKAGEALKNISIGETGYLYAMTPTGDLTAHIAQEGENIYDAQDENGRYFIQEMIQRALAAEPGEVLYILYPWRNESLGDKRPREKIVAYTYFAPWDWILAAGSYLEEENLAFERRAFQEMKESILSKKVGETGYIYAMTTDGELQIHPFLAGERIDNAQDDNGRYFIREMCERKNGWIRYPWQNETDPAPRMKIVRYRYFEPWRWIVAVGSYQYLRQNTGGRQAAVVR